MSTASLFERRKVLAERFHRYGYRLLRGFEGGLAKRNQQRFCGTYVGITGSCGKSTTSHLVAAVLATSGSVARGHLINIERGVFRTLRKLSRPVDYVVQEISAGGGPGSLANMMQTLRIDVAIVTTIGKEHRAAFADIEAIAAEKSRLPRAVHANGLSVLNADDPHVLAMAPHAGGRIITYGRSPKADVRAENVEARWPARLAFDLVTGNERRRVATRFAGTMMLPNVLAALAVAKGLNLDIDRAIEAIGGVDPVYEHMSVNVGGDGHTYVLDTNKAPLWSTILLVDDLPNFATPDTVLILAQISDTFGDRSQWYRKLLRKASKSVGLVITMDMAAKQAIKLIEEEGIDNIVCLDNIDQVAATLRSRPPSLVVVKSADVTKLSRLYLSSLEPVSCLKQHCELKMACARCPILRAAEAQPVGA